MGAQNENDTETSDFDKEMYFEILKDDPPMKSYVSRGDTRDTIDIPGPHQDADRLIFRSLRFMMKDGKPRFQPVLGAAGMGKTHLFWALKDQETSLSDGKFLTVYVPSPPSPVRVPLHFHACIVDEAGEALFEQAVDMLITKFGGLKGVTHELYDYAYALERLLGEYPGISADVVRVLLRFRLDPSQHDLARRWLFGDALSDEEAEKLGVRTILEEDDVTLATLKLLLEGSETPLILFIDEMEGPFNTHGIEGERHFLEIIKRLYNESKNVMIIAASLEDVWERIYSMADGPTKSRMDPATHLKHFSKDDLFSFVTKSMKEYWTDRNVDPPPDPLFPFSESDISAAFAQSHGNPREAIKDLIPRLDTILFGEPIEEVEPQPEYVIKLTAAVMIGAIAKALSITGQKLGVDVLLQVGEFAAKKQATSIIGLAKGGESQMLCIDIANVKDWNRSGGVSAFYSVKRLKKLIDAGDAKYAIVAVPAATKGAKFQAICDDMGDDLKILRFSEESAKALVKATTDEQLEKEQSDMFEELINSIF